MVAVEEALTTRYLHPVLVWVALAVAVITTMALAHKVYLVKARLAAMVGFFMLAVAVEVREQ
jgi:hypothetical protein